MEFGYSSVSSSNPSYGIRRTLLICLIIFCAAVLWVVMTNSRNNGKTELAIKTVPDRISIEVNEKPWKGKLSLPPGSYKITGSKDGFKSHTYDVIIGEGGSSIYANTLFFLLQPVSAEAREWASNNQRKYLQLEEEVGELRAAEGEAQAAANPILEKLPYRGSLYNIDYTFRQPDDMLVVQITADDALGRQVALETIRLWGYEPTDLNIEFLNHDNPFAPIGSQSEGEVESR